MSRGSMEMFESTQKQIVQKTAIRARFTTARRALVEHPRSGSDHSVDLGVGGMRSTSLLLDWRCSQLLWLNRSISIIGRQTTTWPNIQTKKRLATDGADRSGQAGTAMESAVGHTLCQTIGTGPSQSGYSASGAKAGCLSAGCGQKRSTLPGSDSAANTGKRHENKKKTASLDRQSRLTAEISSLRSVSDPPAGPRVFGDCARELHTPYTPYCLFRGRPVRTHSIFAANAYPALFPQMDVWPRCLCVGLVRGSRTVRYANALPVGRTPSAKSRGISVSP